ncbi:phenylalanine--tRNA ligase subunit beta [Actinotalea sp. K2]|uniref:phenylalanine--tRNA ligase subunit beta n=1 Tax=Actinotalea sp. K2 TaxID=2939438 RepID=UPI002017F343|nr:phenylalanine--tRNA ligase subunit beta [Actinotalea sp. K2]MCL3860087.1 phenylalanine--tRNA ligase subunit beta [Actinotalea sp. K2]
MPRIPLGWLAEHTTLPLGTTAEQLAADLVRVGLEEEAVHPAAVTGPLVVGEVVELSAEPQKNGKTINWCLVDVGSHNEATDGGGSRPRGIVCGAHNFAVGDRVVVALPGAVLPGPFPIAARKTYGHVSDGMICSARELGLGEDHEGIIVLSRLGLDATPGTDARELLGLGEEVLEINVTPDRGYCFSLRGVAREYSHATGSPFVDRGLEGPHDGPVADGVEGTFGVELADDAPVHGVPGCDRFVAQVVRGVAASGPSPAWMQRRLTQAGMRPISLAVDVTNYVMLDLGQPLHAYDLARLAAPIVVRRAAPGESLTTLDGAVRALDAEDLLITDSTGGARGGRVLGLAGVMGGADSEVGDGTTDLLVEAAHFDPVTVARTARRHRVPSEAAKRFERGVDPRLPRVAVRRVVELLVEHGGGTPDSVLTDVDRTSPAPSIPLAVDLPARLVGVGYTPTEVRQTLEEIGCVVSDEVPSRDGRSATVQVQPPSWRPDLTVPVDLVEEVARLRGYEAIPSVLPVAPAGRGLTAEQRARRAVARSLAEHGLVEVLSYPFVGEHQHDELGLPAGDERRRAVRLLNPMSHEQPLMRTSLLVTLLDTVRRNVARGTTDLAVFEMGLVTRPVDGAPSAPRLAGGVLPSPEDLARLDAAVPAQPRRVAGVLAGLREPAGWWGAGRRADHTDAIGAALRVATTLGVELGVVADAGHAPWHPGRTARLELLDGSLVGHAGELHPGVVATLGLPARTVAFEIDLDLLVGAAPDGPVQATPVSTFPVAKEDIALVVDMAVPAAAVLDAVRVGASSSVAGDIVEELRLFDVYSGTQVGEGKKSLAFSLRLRAPDRTLTSVEAAGVREAALAEANRQVGAVLRS